MRRILLATAGSALLSAGLVAVACAREPARSTTVEMRGFEFRPTAVEVNVGDTVVWVNQDVVPHTATAAGWDSGEMRTGARWALVASAPGTVDYVCAYHPAMRGRLIVR